MHAHWNLDASLYTVAFLVSLLYGYIIGIGKSDITTSFITGLAGLFTLATPFWDKTPPSTAGSVTQAGTTMPRAWEIATDEGILFLVTLGLAAGITIGLIVYNKYLKSTN